MYFEIPACFKKKPNFYHNSLTSFLEVLQILTYNSVNNVICAVFVTYIEL